MLANGKKWDIFAVQRGDCECPAIPKPAGRSALNILAAMTSLGKFQKVSCERAGKRKRPSVQVNLHATGRFDVGE